MIYLAISGFIISFILLFKSANFFVDGASGIARVLDIPKMLTGIVLVGLATTAPEFIVSVLAAAKHHPEIALGNAIGSVICDDGLALGLAAVLAPSVILVNCRLLKRVGIFLISIDLFAYFLSRNGRIGQVEGLILVSLLVLYFMLLYKNRKFSNKDKVSSRPKKEHLKKPVLLFGAGLAGVIVSGNIIVESAIYIARYFSINEIIIGSTIIAIGTSLPEISTCIIAVRKGEGEIAVGNIIGADVLNILWIIGISAIVNPIYVELDIINFVFPFMILIVVVMLAAMLFKCRLEKWKGFVLLGLYVAYLYLTIQLFI